MSAAEQVRAIAREHGLDPVHPPDVLAEVAACSADTDDSTLHDLRHLLGVDFRINLSDVGTQPVAQDTLGDVDSEFPV